MQSQRLPSFLVIGVRHALYVRSLASNRVAGRRDSRGFAEESYTQSIISSWRHKIVEVVDCQLRKVQAKSAVRSDATAGKSDVHEDCVS